MFLKNRKTHRQLIIAIMFMILAVPPVMAESGQQHTRPLSGQQLQSIQSMSRAVLAAKHSRKEAPELAEMRKQVEELASSISAFRAQRMKAAMLTMEALKKGPDENGVIKADPEAVEKLKLAEKASLDNIHAVIKRVRNKRLAIQQAITQKTITQKTITQKTIAPSNKGRQRHQLLQAANKLEQLETELQSILSGPEGQKMMKLDKLQQRMKLKSHNPIRPVNDTPTISTLVKHRVMPE